MVTELQIDGVYRPVRSSDGQWRVVAYIPFRGTVNQSIASDSINGRTFSLCYGDQPSAQRKADQLNNVQPDHEFQDWKEQVRSQK